MSTYPEWARPGIELVWEGVDLGKCAPDPQVRRKSLQIGDMIVRPGDKLVTYVSRDLEPYRGFHIMMRALPSVSAITTPVGPLLPGQARRLNAGGIASFYGTGPGA